MKAIFLDISNIALLLPEAAMPSLKVAPAKPRGTMSIDNGRLL